MSIVTISYPNINTLKTRLGVNNTWNTDIPGNNFPGDFLGNGTCIKNPLGFAFQQTGLMEWTILLNSAVLIAAIPDPTTIISSAKLSFTHHIDVTSSTSGEIGSFQISSIFGTTTIVAHQFQGNGTNISDTHIMELLLIPVIRDDIINIGGGIIAGVGLYHDAGATPASGSFSSNYSNSTISLILTLANEVNSIFPNSGGMFGGANVSITGKGFTSGTVTNVYFGGVPATQIFVINDITLSCFTPAHISGPVVVGVEINDGTNVTITNSLTPIFTYLSPITQQNPTVPIKIGDVIKFDTNINTIGTFVGTPTPFNQIQGLLNTVIQIQLSWIDSSGITQTIFIDDNNNPYSIIVRNENELWFTLPIGFGTFSGTVTITFVFDGTEFSGSVNVGTLQFLFEDASGIYVLNKNQTNDLLYFREGFITDTKLIMLPDIREDETIYKDDFFRQLPYPRRILAQDDIDDDLESSDFSMISILRQIVVTESVEIPSPFIKTAFLPE